MLLFKVAKSSNLETKELPKSRNPKSRILQIPNRKKFKNNVVCEKLVEFLKNLNFSNKNGKKWNFEYRWIFEKSEFLVKKWNFENDYAQCEIDFGISRCEDLFIILLSSFFFTTVLYSLVLKLSLKKRWFHLPFCTKNVLVMIQIRLMNSLSIYLSWYRSDILMTK